MVELGTRPGLHGNTVTENTINFGRNSYSVYHSILACLHRGRTGTVRTMMAKGQAISENAKETHFILEKIMSELL